MTEVDVVPTDPAEHGEGPVWDSAGRRLLWVDITGQEVRAFHPDSGVDHRWTVGSDVGCVAPLQAGGLIVATSEGFRTLDEQGAFREIASPLAEEPSLRMNDGGCDPAGRFWAGSMAYDSKPGAGTLYRLELNGVVTTVLTGITISNGLAWSPGGDYLYYVDSATYSIDCFRYHIDDGSITERRSIVTIPEAVGEPDGLAIDAEGCLWAAIWDGGQVQRYAPDGRFLSRIRLPVSRVTSCAFGGPRLRHLYISTSQYGLTGQDLASQPLAGSLFVAEPGVAGIAPPACAYEPKAP